MFTTFLDLSNRGTVFGRPFVKRSANGPPCGIGPLSVLSVLLSCLSVCNVGVLWPNGWTDQNET